MPTINQNRIVDDQIQIPVELWECSSELFIVSLTLPRGYFREPFFIDSLAKSFDILKSEIKLPKEDELLARPVHYDDKDGRVIYTPMNKFIEKYSGIKTNKKLGFIFHMSRCGSTLASQMLASSDRFFVLSEPTIINSVLDTTLNLPQEKRNVLLCASIKALAFCSPIICEQVFIKFRSWNILYLDQILKNLPGVSWMFIHRHGLEVLQSVLEKPPGWLRSRRNYAKYFAGLLEVGENDIRVMSDNEYATRILGTFCRVAKNSTSKNRCFVDYRDLKDSFIVIAKKLWDIDLNNKEAKIINHVSQLYSKDINKKERFNPDSEEKRAKANKVQIELTDRFVESERVKLINE